MSGQIVVRLAIALVTFLLSFPWQTLDPLGVGVALVWSIFAALLLSLELTWGLILTATSTSGFLLAYSHGLGDAVAEGSTLEGVTASGEGVLGAMVGLAMFLTVVAWVSSFVRNIGRRIAPAREARQAARPDVAFALLAFLGLCLTAAIGAGTWSHWNGGAEVPAEGGIELVYPPCLLTVMAYGTLGWLDGTLPPRRLGFLITGVVAASLLFILQSRRMMVAVAILMALAFVVSARRQALRSLALKVGAIAAALVVFTLASSGWRSVAADEMLTLADRVERAVEAVGDPNSFEGFESRLTYLWFDAMTHDLHKDQGAEVDGGALLASAVVTAVPRSLFPAKTEFDQVSCENGLEGFSGMEADLPCTPTAEGFLMAGFLGVLLAGFLWGLTLGVVEACVERGPGVMRVFGLFLFYQFVLVETGVFATVSALRLGLIGAGSVWLIAAIVRLGRGLQERRPRQRSS